MASAKAFSCISKDPPAVAVEGTGDRDGGLFGATPLGFAAPLTSRKPCDFFPGFVWVLLSIGPHYIATGIAAWCFH